MCKKTVKRDAVGSPLSVSNDARRRSSFSIQRSVINGWNYIRFINQTMGIALQISQINRSEARNFTESQTSLNGCTKKNISSK